MTTSHPAIGKRCIIRGYASGVHLATITDVRATQGIFSAVTAVNARRIRYWCGSKEAPARDVSEVALNGICTAKSQVHANVEEKYIEDILEIIPATAEAIASIEATTSESK